MNFKKEFARDTIGLGGIAFFVLILARISILQNYFYLSKVAAAGILFLILAYFFKAEMRAGLSLVAAVFTSIYYNDLKFTIFAIIIYFFILASLVYLKYDKKKIVKGIILGGIISVLISLV